MSDKYYVIKHASRGVLVDFSGENGRPRFRYSIRHNEGRHYTDVSLLERVLRRCHARGAKGAFIIDMSSGKRVTLKEIKTSQYPNGQPTPEQIRAAFESTANAIYGDVMQACRTMGEPEVLHRDGVVDYIEMYGGPHAKAVQAWVYNMPGTMEDTEKALDQAGVPRTWV